MTKRTIAAMAGLGLMVATLGACSTLAGAGLGGSLVSMKLHGIPIGRRSLRPVQRIRSYSIPS